MGEGPLWDYLGMYGEGMVRGFKFTVFSFRFLWISRPQVAKWGCYLERQGDLVSRLIMAITRVTI